MRYLFLALGMVLALAGCRGSDDAVTASDLQIEIEPADEMVGETMFTVNLRDAEGNPVDDAHVNLFGNMDMAGMEPVIRDIESGTDGIYETPFEWTMGGEWYVDVTVTLPNDEVAKETFNYMIAVPDGEMDMSDMDMDMGDGPTSAVYMTINSDTDNALTSVESDVAGAVELHMTMVDDNDVASMMQQAEIVLPAGEDVILEPGGLHIMLIDVQETLIEGETLPLTLIFADGATVDVDAMIQNEAPEDMTVSADGLTISNVWVRPIAVETMDMGADVDMDAEDAEETDTP